MLRFRKLAMLHRFNSRRRGNRRWRRTLRRGRVTRRNLGDWHQAATITRAPGGNYNLGNSKLRATGNPTSCVIGCVKLRKPLGVATFSILSHFFPTQSEYLSNAVCRVAPSVARALLPADGADPPRNPAITVEERRLSAAFLTPNNAGFSPCELALGLARSPSSLKSLHLLGGAALALRLMQITMTGFRR